MNSLGIALAPFEIIWLIKVMKKLFIWSLPLVVLCAFAILRFQPWQKSEQPEPQPVPAPASPAEPAVRYPVESDPSAPPLPALAESDQALEAELAALLGKGALEFLHLKNIVHRVVATVDNLPRDHLAPRLMPVKAVAGLPLTKNDGATTLLSPSNGRRYQAYVRLADTAPTGALVALYARFYPLFQEQYEALGYPGKHFNDRVIEVIDHLLATPDAPEPLRLVQSRVLYEFADPKLESLSAGQKILLRVGKENREKLQSKLRELRQELTSLGTVQ